MNRISVFMRPLEKTAGSSRGRPDRSQRGKSGGEKGEVRHELVLKYKWVGPMERTGIPVKSEMALRNKMITQMTWKRWHGKMVT